MGKTAMGTPIRFAPSQQPKPQKESGVARLFSWLLQPMLVPLVDEPSRFRSPHQRKFGKNRCGSKAKKSIRLLRLERKRQRRARKRQRRVA
jgi:hypothetical protein